MPDGERATGRGLLLPFDSRDSEFARGFEAGRLWALVREHPDEPVEEYANTTNVEMILRIAEATGRAVRSTELGDRWLLVRFAAVGGAPTDQEVP